MVIASGMEAYKKVGADYDNPDTYRDYSLRQVMAHVCHRKPDINPEFPNNAGMRLWYAGALQKATRADIKRWTKELMNERKEKLS